MAHSVETPVSTYVGALPGDDTAVNEVIDSTLAGSRERVVVEMPKSSHALPGEGGKSAQRGALAVDDVQGALGRTPFEPIPTSPDG